MHCSWRNTMRESIDHNSKHPINNYTMNAGKNMYFVLLFRCKIDSNAYTHLCICLDFIIIKTSGSPSNTNLTDHSVASLQWPMLPCAPLAHFCILTHKLNLLSLIKVLLQWLNLCLSATWYHPLPSTYPNNS